MQHAVESSVECPVLGYDVRVRESSAAAVECQIARVGDMIGDSRSEAYNY